MPTPSGKPTAAEKREAKRAKDLAARKVAAAPLMADPQVRTIAAELVAMARSGERVEIEALGTKVQRDAVLFIVRDEPDLVAFSVTKVLLMSGDAPTNGIAVSLRR